MTRRAGYGAVAMALLLVLAGCNAFTSGANTETEPEEGVTALPVNTPTAVDASGGTPAAADFPGVAGDGSLDLEALVRSHVETLANRSFTLEWAKRVVGEVGPPQNAYDRRVAVVNATTYHRQDEGTMFAGAETTYADPSGDYRRVRLDNGTTVNGIVVDPVDDPRDRYAGIVTSVATEMLEPTATDVDVVRRDGVYYARLFTQTAPSILSAVYADFEVVDFRATAWIAPDGFIKTLHYEYDLEQSDQRSHVELRYTYSDVGETTVTKPAWVTAIQQEGSTSTPGTTTPSNATTVGTGEETETDDGNPPESPPGSMRP